MTNQALEIDYRATGEYFRELAGTRFRLLALVPSVTGLAIALADLGPPSSRFAALGFFGFLVTLGVLFYDVRNTQLYDALQLRAKCLEAYMGFPKASNRQFERGGAFLDRPRRSLTLFRTLLIWHDRGLAIIYSSSLAGWSYVALAGMLGLPSHKAAYAASWMAFVVPPVIWIAFFLQLYAFDCATDEASVLPPDVRELLKRPALPGED